MSEKAYNKLVRDKIPQIIFETGKQAIISVLNEQEYLKMLNKKLIEEIKEYISSGEIEELVDIQEVIYALIEAKNVSKEAFEKLRIEKYNLRGGFSKKILLKAVTDDRNMESVLETNKILTLKEFVRMVDVQEGTIRKYLRNGRIIPDNNSENEKPLFKISTIYRYAREFGWGILNKDNIKVKFIDYINAMVMDHSYKPVLIEALFKYADLNGRVKLSDIVNFYISFYESRRKNKIIVEQKDSIFSTENYSFEDVERLIFTYPYEVMSEMSFIDFNKNDNCIVINPYIFSKLSSNEIEWILNTCEERLKQYFSKIIN